ncbi:MAG: hypothetical protein AAB263_20110 [Planctomycetota bacterium]
MIRSATVRLVPALLALCAVGSAVELDPQQAFCPLAVNGKPLPEAFVGIDAALKSKALDDNRVIQNDAALGLRGTGRYMGAGLTIDTDWAVGQDRDISRPGSFTSAGEWLRLSATLDWAIEIRDPRKLGVPLLQIIPHFNVTTYPNQRDNNTGAAGENHHLKDSQRWLGVDVWWCTPIEGMEIGAGIEQNASGQWRATRGAFGAREFIQYAAIDLAMWQKLTFSDAEYRELVSGLTRGGVNALELGARASMATYKKELYAFAELNLSYWTSKTARSNMRAGGQDGSNVVMSFGLTYFPD